jgi:phage terminase small subunit
MGFRGPVPVPTAKKEALGIATHHKRNTAEPRLKAETKAPPCPRDFDADERRHWKEIWRNLIAMRIGTQADMQTARNCARNRGDIDKLRRTIQVMNSGGSGLDGFVMVVGGQVVEITGDDGKTQKKRVGGQLQPNTLYSLYQQAVDRDTKISALLGMDPANRTRLQMPLLDDKPKSKWGDTKPILTSKPA